MLITDARVALVCSAMALCVGLGVGGSVWADDEASPEPPQQATIPSGYVDDRDPESPSRPAQEAIDSALAGLDREMFASVKVGPPPESSGRAGNWFYVETVSADSTRFGALEIWEARLAQGAIAEKMARDGDTSLAQVIVGATITASDKQGRPLQDNADGAGDIVVGQKFGAERSGESDEEIIVGVQRTMRDLKLIPVEVRVLRPLGPAVVVVAKVADLSILKGEFDNFHRAILGDPMRFEGLYLEIQGPDGTPIVRGSSSYRSGAGTLWFADGYDEFVGAAHGSVVGSAPPNR